MCLTKYGTKIPPKDSPAMCSGCCEKAGKMSVKRVKRRIPKSTAASVSVEGREPLAVVEKTTPAGWLWELA
jgi:hypothetical protein